MMRHIRAFGLLIVAFIVMAGGAFGAPPSNPTCATQSKLVESTIAAVARNLNGKEYCQFRRYQGLYDVDGDDTDDFIVLFSVEGIGGGGNNHYDFMSVFLSRRKWQPLTVKTGGRGERDPISVEVTNRRITLETLVHRPSDALCCPSGKGTLVYEVIGNQLSLTAETTKQADPTVPSGEDKTPAR